MKEREAPVVHQQVRGPDQFRVDSDAFHASIFAYIPVQLVVEPILGNVSLEKMQLGQNSLLTKFNHKQVIKSWFFSSCGKARCISQIFVIYILINNTQCLFVTDGCVIENVSSGNKLTRECV